LGFSNIICQQFKNNAILENISEATNTRVCRCRPNRAGNNGRQLNPDYMPFFFFKNQKSKDSPPTIPPNDSEPGPTATYTVKPFKNNFSGSVEIGIEIQAFRFKRAAIEVSDGQVQWYVPAEMQNKSSAHYACPDKNRCHIKGSRLTRFLLVCKSFIRLVNPVTANKSKTSKNPDERSYPEPGMGQGCGMSIRYFPNNM
jgi:hypothetical protein